MKILFIHNRYKERGGEDVVLHQEVDLLITAGHSVEVIEFDNEVLSSGLKKFSFIFKVFHNFRSAAVIKAKISQFLPDVIHVHNFYYAASPSIFYAAKSGNVPVVHTLHNFRLICSAATLLRDNKICELCVHDKFPIHGIRYRCFQRSGFKTLLLTLLTGLHKLVGTWRQKIDQYIVLTEFLKQKFISSSAGLSPSQITVKPNFVSDHGFSSHSERENYYLFVGRLTETKGVSTLIEAFEIADLNLEIIGDGELREFVRNSSKKNSNIRFHGFQDREFTIAKLKKCKALIFPSIWYEGMPMVLLEAFSTGTPVIATDISNINQIVIDGLNGLLFTLNSSQSLRETIFQFEKNRGRSEAMYENARRVYLENYTPELGYNRLMSIYSNVRDARRTI